MFNTKTHRTVASLVLGITSLAAPYVCRAATSSAVQLSGVIAGVVSSSQGVPQMGAAVVLYDRKERVIERALTDERGEFKFASLFPDVYSIKVSLAAFVPAMRKDILVQPGMRSVLAVNLNTLFSSIQIAYPPLENGSLMTNDWKWVLRSASAARPVLRFTEDLPGIVTGRATRTAMFSDTRGLLKFSAGDGALATGIGSQADLGTAFALATSLRGNNVLQLSGNVGYGSQTGVPTAAFRTSYTRDMGGGTPEFSVTMRQLFLPGRLAAAFAGSDSALPVLRTVSAGFDDHTQVTDDVTFQYGFTMDSVSFLDHMNYFSPYARLNYAMGDGATLEFAFTSGNARPDLAGATAEEADLQRDLDTLGLFPALSLRGARPRVQHGEEFELTYARKVGSRTYSISGYRELVTDAALTLVAPAGLYSGGDILPDLFSASSIFNAGDYQSNGYTAAIAQTLGPNVTATVMYGSMGVLTADKGELVSNNPDELRSMIHASRRHAATARVAAVSPWTGTHFIASYQWTADPRWAMAGNLYSTQSYRPMPGLNIYIRQPIPGLAGRVEATADFRNMLAQGYLPIGIVNGQRVMLVQTPRTVRGGLSFIF